MVYSFLVQQLKFLAGLTLNTLKYRNYLGMGAIQDVLLI